MRTLQPHHTALATSRSGRPNRPHISGLSTFERPVAHSSEYRGGEATKGRRVVVVASGNSAHDIAQDLHSQGAAVTMVQRNPTTVMCAASADEVYMTAAPIEDYDLIATTHRDVVVGCRLMTSRMMEFDRELLLPAPESDFVPTTATAKREGR